MRISDWSSDVCSSDLGAGTAAIPRLSRRRQDGRPGRGGALCDQAPRLWTLHWPLAPTLPTLASGACTRRPPSWRWRWYWPALRAPTTPGEPSTGPPLPCCWTRSDERRVGRGGVGTARDRGCKCPYKNKKPKTYKI